MCRKTFTLALLFSIFHQVLFGQCGTDPVSGTTNIGTPATIVNSYFAGTGNPTAGSSSFNVAAIDGRGNATTLALNDLVLIIQMQGADITSTDNSSYGDGVAGAPGSGYLGTNLYAGYYEYNRVTSLSGGLLTLTYPLANNYYTRAFTAGNSIRSFQVIRVPRNYDLTISAGNSVTAPAWNGLTGGVVVLDAANIMTISGSINADAIGFRAGGGRNFTGSAASLSNTAYVWNSPVTTAANTTGSAKGEGIAGTPSYVLPQNGVLTVVNTVEGYVNGSYGRGAPANAGGGATDGAPTNNGFNPGGGGGGNGGTGGNGGSGWHGGSGNSTSYPTGGFGGVTFSQHSISRVIMGGGGGAGTANNSTAMTPNEYQSSGGCGGGIIILRAKSYAGNGSISANGGAAPGVIGVSGTANTDAAGGGGAGGTIVAVTKVTGAAGLNSVNASAVGGRGGDMSNYHDHGPGGGGGGGIIYTNGTFASTTVTGGTNGLTRTGSGGPLTNAFGSTPGNAGLVITLAVLPVLYNNNSVTSPCGVLPITLRNFYGLVRPTGITLYWEVGESLNFHHFEVESSTDGQSYQYAGSVSYVASVDEYQFTQPTPGSNVIYYRLKMVDNDGVYSYSKTIVIRLNAERGAVLLFPNPTRNSATLQFTYAGNSVANLSIVDQSGRIVNRRSFTIQNGINFYPIDCSQLSAGVYIVQLDLKDGTIVKRKLTIAGE